MTQPAPDTATIDAVRHFSRFYTRRIGLLEDGFLHSDFTLTEGRILYELAQRGSASATDLCRDLGLDAGYLSRIVKRFARDGLIARKRDMSDARRTLLSLTSKGLAAFKPLEAESRTQIGELLAPLGAAERKKVVDAMAGIEAALERRPAVADVTLRPHRVGDIGLVASRQALIYHREYGWDIAYEALAVEILASFVRDFDADRERAWIAELDGEMVGAVFLVRKDDETAKLRLLHVEPAARGLGLGRRLVDECIRFGREKGYRTLTLWTNDVLVAARKIYVAAGFRLVAEDRHHSFGKDLVGQTWELAL
ncbi:MAG: GNAT family N-acetyltransferase [Rhizobiaceae bacterium]